VEDEPHRDSWPRDGDGENDREDTDVCDIIILVVGRIVGDDGDDGEDGDGIENDVEEDNIGDFRESVSAPVLEGEYLW